MKRDMELCRAILKAIEEGPETMGGWTQVAVPGHSQEAVQYNSILLSQAGYIDLPKSQPGMLHVVAALTWQGHEFLDAAKSEPVWKSATGRIASTIGSASVEIVKAVLVDEAKKMLGLTHG